MLNNTLSSLSQNSHFISHLHIIIVEIGETLKKIKRTEKVELDNTPIEVWRGFGVQGIRWLTNSLMLSCKNVKCQKNRVTTH